jgi:hypothetical protein
MSKMDSNDLAYTSFGTVASKASTTTTPTESSKVTFDQIAAALLKNNLTLTALEFHTELAEAGRELPRLRDFFSNPANFEQQSAASAMAAPSSSYYHHHAFNNAMSSSSLMAGGDAGFPLHKASSIQTFDSLDLTRYSDDNDQSKEDKIAVLEFELRKARETIHQLRNTLTMTTGNLFDEFVNKPKIQKNPKKNFLGKIS